MIRYELRDVTVMFVAAREWDLVHCEFASRLVLTMLPGLVEPVESALKTAALMDPQLERQKLRCVASCLRDWLVANTSPTIRL